MSAFDGGHNRSMQHTNDCASSRSVADEAADPNLLHRRAEVPDVGSMAARWGVASDRTAVRSAPLVGSRDSRGIWRYPSTGAQALATSVDPGRARSYLTPIKRDGGS